MEIKKLIILWICFLSTLCNYAFTQQNWQTLDSLRQVYQVNQDYNTALNYAKRALQKAEETDGKKSAAYAEMLSGVLTVTYYLGDYENAIQYGNESNKIIQEQLGNINDLYAYNCTWIGYIYNTLGEYQKAEPICLEAKNIYEKLFGRKHALYANATNVLGNIYFDIGDFKKSEKLYKEAINIRAEVLGTNHFDYAISLGNLASLYKTKGDYEKAEPLFIEAKSILKKVYGEDNVYYGSTLSHLAAFYREKGDYKKAEPLYLEASKIYKNSAGENHYYYAISLSDIATLYNDMGNYEKAEPKYLEAIEVYKISLGTNHLYYSTALMGLAAMYYYMEDYEKAEPLYLEVKEIRKNSVGVEHVDYALALNNLAALYIAMNKYSESEALYLEAIKIQKKVLGNDHPDYAISLNNLAALYKKSGDYEKAEPLYIEALEIYNIVFGEEHPDNTVYLSNLGVLYEVLGNKAKKHNEKNSYYTKAETILLKSTKLVNSNIFQNFSFLSEKEKEMYIKTKYKYYNIFNSFALRRKEENPAIVNYVYDNAIKNKGLLLKSSTAMRNTVLSSNDAVLIEKYEKWIDLKKEISKLYSTAIDKRTKDIKQIEMQANIIEKELVKDSQIFLDFNKLQNISWKDVQKSLKPNEACIEFVHFKLYEKDWTDTIMYCALVVTPKSQFPKMVPLFEEKQLEKIIGKFGGNNFSYINNIYGKNNQVKTELYDLIWKPIEESLEGINKVYISPSGLLHKISFSAIAKEQNVYLCDNFDIEVKSTTSKIIDGNIYTLNEANTSATLFGGINYDTENTTQKIWSYLDGSKSEAEKINSILNTGKVEVNYFSNTAATEEEFKLMASNSDILHIATHGFFYPDPTEIEEEEVKKTETGDVAFRGGDRGFGVNSFVKNKNPLMRSGLVFAGANDVWSIPKADSTDDGVLTAHEVAQIDMRNTGLVVMSACETGLGDIKGGEGVYGLQRSFKMAGVNFLVMSLWQVPDNETKEFMTIFYQKLLERIEIKQAFKETQNQMREKYDPYFWAAFILIE